MSNGAEHIPETAKWLGCTVPPEGWWCSREPGHDGPCAARPETGEPGWSGLRQPVTHAEQAADYKGLVREARDLDGKMMGAYVVGRLADAVEALVELRQLRATQIQALQRNWELKAAQWDAEREQMRTDLDVRFEHSDHQSAKYYRRMRVAERVAEMNGAQRDEALQVLGEVRAERDALQAKLDAMRTEERWLRLAADARGKIIPARLLKEQRLVSEWTVVEGEQP